MNIFKKAIEVRDWNAYLEFSRTIQVIATDKWSKVTSVEISDTSIECLDLSIFPPNVDSIVITNCKITKLTINKEQCSIRNVSITNSDIDEYRGIFNLTNIRKIEISNVNHNIISRLGLTDRVGITHDMSSYRMGTIDGSSSRYNVVTIPDIDGTMSVVIRHVPNKSIFTKLKNLLA